MFSTTNPEHVKARMSCYQGMPKDDTDNLGNFTMQLRSAIANGNITLIIDKENIDHICNIVIVAVLVSELLKDKPWLIGRYNVNKGVARASVILSWFKQKEKGKFSSNRASVLRALESKFGGMLK